MEITYLPSERKEIVSIHCPDCGQRVKSVGIDPDNCNIDGLSCVCKRCHKLFAIRTSSSTKK